MIDYIRACVKAELSLNHPEMAAKLRAAKAKRLLRVNPKPEEPTPADENPVRPVRRKLRRGRRE